MEPFSSICVNLLSSIVYDIGKSYIKNKKKPLTEEQMMEIISTFQKEINSVYDRLGWLEDSITNIKIQNETIFKLLLLIFDNNSDIFIKYSPNGYQIEGNYSLDDLNHLAGNCLVKYVDSLPVTRPKTLGEAIWPLANEMKGELLDELEKNLYEEN